jgi:hypothetical protein
MPAPTTKCYVCNQVVLKAQTYHIGNGNRACKSHEGVVDKAQNAQAQIKADLKNKYAEEEARRKRAWKSFDANIGLNKEMVVRSQIWAWFKCWCCGGDGIQLVDFYHRLMIAHERLRLKLGESAIVEALVHPEKLLPELQIPVGTKILRRLDLPVDTTQIFREINKHGPTSQMSTVAQLAGIVQVCPECAARHKLEFWPQLNLPPLETLALFGEMYEKDVKPELSAIASYELNQESSQVSPSVQSIKG